jgi:Ca2+-binding RTX toxin-like protein
MFNFPSLQLAQYKLTKFAGLSDFATKMEIAFGNQLDRFELTNLQQRWQQGDFAGLPEIEVLQNGELGSASGAYATVGQKIYLSASFLATASTEQIVGVLIEEIGHFLDRVLNIGDSIGDEGALFSELVQGHTLSATEIMSLQAEDDHALVTINGQQLWVEQANITGNDSNNVLNGTTSNDVISGLGGNDALSGFNGNDVLIGGSGSDTFTGGAGNDTIFLENFNGGSFENNLDVVTDFFRGQDKIDVSRLGISNFNTVLSLISNDSSGNALVSTHKNGFNGSYGLYSLQFTGLNRTLLTATDFVFATNVSDDSLVGGTYNDDLFGGFGNDTLAGGAGDDRLFGEQGNDVLEGGAGNDDLAGFDGNDVLIGGSGSDTFTGGAGNDTIFLENFNGGSFENNLDVVTDFFRGQDKIDVSKLGISNFNTVLSLISNDSSGNALISTHKNGFNGSYGLYNLQFTGLNRTLLTATDFVFATNISDDSLVGGIYNDDLFGGFGNDTLVGGAGDDRLFGEQGNDVLEGGNGFDTLVGDLGNDIYIVDTTTDIITEAVNQGVDTVQSSITFNLATLTNIENLTLTASAVNGTGNAGNNVLTGNNVNNTLNGGDGNDTLNGGNGVDTLVGGLGNDIYIVDTTTDIITEAVNQGIDIIQSSIIFSLATLTNIENLTLTGSSAINGTGNAGNNILTGNNVNNTLNGGNGNDTLNGGNGVDTLVGGLGNDVYVVDSASDIIIENSTVAAEIDTIESSVTYSIELATNVENIRLTGASVIDATGNNLNNNLTGNTANNILTGGRGQDTLSGGAGSDRFNYKVLTDSLLTNFDAITDLNTNPNNDIFLVATARTSFTNFGTITSLDNAGISSKLTTISFGANAAGQFTFAGRTFVAINDQVAGFNALTDAIVEVTGVTGTIGVNNFST